MLRLAACLEEHYPHSMANAVVAAAKEKGLSHEEYHSSVEYVVAHGISSTVENEKVIIGSAHFVFEDEGCVVPEGDEELFNSLSGEYSHLYLAVSGVLAAVICISDPLRAEAADAINALHNCGISKIVMMTGDNRRRSKRFSRTVRSRRRYCHKYRSRHSKGDCRHHGIVRRPLYAGNPQKNKFRTYEKDSPQLPLYRIVQSYADTSRRRRNNPTDDLGAVPQCLNPCNQP